MKRIHFTILLLLFIGCIAISFTSKDSDYVADYTSRLQLFREQQEALLSLIQKSNLASQEDVDQILGSINQTRSALKGMDFWLRYLEPIAYKKINGPLPVEWETEVFEKFEKPYKREGAGLTLAALYLEEDHPTTDSLQSLISQSLQATETYAADSITGNLNGYQHFYLCNRLYLLNLAAIYTTGFECPDTSRVIPELQEMMKQTENIYNAFNKSFPANKLSDEYLQQYEQALAFVKSQSSSYSSFNHYRFIRDYVNPLFTKNQELIRRYRVFSRSYVDYALNKKSQSIFSKDLYNGQNPKGIFLRVDDTATLHEISALGRLLFYDPILSANNQLSCHSCHKSTAYFTDTLVATPLQLDGITRLPRNAPSLINVQYNHLAMLDGKHISLQNQVKDVMTNPIEMGSDEKELLEKILSCKEYKAAFTKLLILTPQETVITMDHIASAITLYYSKFSNYYAPFDEAMNRKVEVMEEVQQGFNLFMSKAQCATCHFVPQFNGIKPPYVSSEFEVLGVPADTAYKKLSADKGRYKVNPAEETLHAMRTGSIRNIEYTKPYMHNGVFTTLDEVINFYNDGGGAGHGLNVPNQTLSSDSLRLTPLEKSQLKAFMHALNEKIPFESFPASLPLSSHAVLNKRVAGGSRQ